LQRTQAAVPVNIYRTEQRSFSAYQKMSVQVPSGPKGSR
jgi:hypothetical protein